MSDHIIMSNLTVPCGIVCGLESVGTVGSDLNLEVKEH